MNTGEEFLKNLEKWGTSKSPSLTTPCITDQLDLPLNLSDFELNLMRDIISAGDTKSPEDFSNFPAMGATPPVDVTQNEVVSGGKDHRPPPLVKEASPERRYKGVYQRRSGKFSAEIHTRNLEKKRLWLGTYDTAEEAAMAFDRAAFKLRGPDAVLNFPDLIGTYDLSPEKDDNNELSPWTEEGSPSPEFSKNQQLCLSSQDQPEAWEIVKDHPRWSPIPLMDAHIQPSKKLKTSDSKTCKTSLDAQICSDFKEEDEEFKALFVFSK